MFIMYVLWFWMFLYLLYMELCKFFEMEILFTFVKFLVLNFDHRGLQSCLFFKFVVFLLGIFWGCGLLFPLFSPWACIGYLFLLTNLSWLGVRTFSLAVEGFMVFFEGDHSWNWFSSLVMFFSHWLSFLMSSVALTLRISIIFLIGHFLMFSIIGLSVFGSFFVLLVVIPIELFFAFLQSYIFLTLVCMFLLNMV
uniref:ATP synthase F0 subunit 6 n=1 Tax=Mansonella perstans TaxID=42231 RepID=A0A6M9ZWL6_9BILA|nr:ATP synthase F0 subunit 6 [Mansonella perstans]QKN98995.1 ATP synthase F0 subunit 6 [Mansonella perstans]WGC93656.1 ATP synthase F0 subunit 6 [Mansonella perstans]WGC93666.1 ATP synthase F0 subunit 6 [Mansonella perstans]WGC93676.1 ATP synthase F0 subunit 6 [Mansonella perstans]